MAKLVELSVNNEPTIGIKRTVFFVSALWFLQMILSALVQVYIAARYGTKLALDIYLVGITIPNTLFMIWSSAFGIATISYFHETRARHNENIAIENITGFVGWVLVATLIASFFLMLSARQIVIWLIPSFTLDAIEKAIEVLNRTAPSLPFLAISTILQGLLQANNHYYSSSISSIVQVSLSPIFLVFGWPSTPESLAWGFDVSAIMSSILLIASTWKFGLLRYKQLYIKDISRMISISLPLSSAGILTHLLWVAERHFASAYGPGAISALSYAQRGNNVIYGALGFGISTVLFPVISQWIEAGQSGRAGRLNKKVLIFTLIPTLFCLTIIYIFGETFVHLILERGAFNTSSTKLTAISFKMYIGVLFCQIVGSIIIRNAVAVKAKRLIFFSSIVLLTSYYILTPLLTQILGFEGIPLSASIAFSLSLIIYFTVLLRKHPYLYVTGK